jgi:hypothetical protein
MDLGPLLFFLPQLLRTRFGWLVLVGAAVFYVARGALVGAGDPHALRGSPAAQTAAPPQTTEVHFVSFVLDDVQANWEKIFTQKGQWYRHTKLVLYTDSTRTGCGFGDAATGPFYCPEDERVYIDLGFFRELSARLGARGQFAEAYVVAHEIGHHVQKQLGISQKVEAARRTTGADGLSVRLELQADCFAGIWARSTEERDLLEAGDIESALGAAAAVGDDRLERAATGTVSPESWTHGSSDERMHWFRQGLEHGSIEACDTFAAKQL